jgi:hypothetical protein
MRLLHFDRPMRQVTPAELILCLSVSLFALLGITQALGAPRPLTAISALTRP